MAMLARVTQAPYLAGQFLLALPGMGDPRFERAVIAMCAHDDEGAIGIGIGATIAGLGFHELLKQVDVDPGEAPDAPVHFGGPVEMRRGFLVHSRDWQGQDTIDVAGRWALSGTTDILRAIAQGKGPAQWVVALGYAGWGAGQLEGELTTPGWFTAPGSTDILWGDGAADRWSNAYAAAGIDPRLLVAGAGHA